MAMKKRVRTGGQKRPMTEEERRALQARRERKERNIREQKEAAASRVSYVKKPVSRRSVICLVLSLIGLALAGGCVAAASATRGKFPFSAGGFALSGILCSVCSFLYGIASFRERDKNCIPARFGAAVSLLLLAAWAVIIIIGGGN